MHYDRRPFCAHCHASGVKHTGLAGTGANLACAHALGFHLGSNKRVLRVPINACVHLLRFQLYIPRSMRLSPLRSLHQLLPITPHLVNAVPKHPPPCVNVTSERPSPSSSSISSVTTVCLSPATQTIPAPMMLLPLLRILHHTA